MAKLSMQGHGSVHQISQLLVREIEASGLSTTLVDSVERTVGSSFVQVMVFEKYYMRSSNRASLTVVVTGIDDQVFVDAIGAGGGQGAFLRFSWGAEEDFVGLVGRILRSYDFS